MLPGSRRCGARMNTNRNTSSQVLGALLRGDTAAIQRMVEEASRTAATSADNAIEEVRQVGTTGSIDIPESAVAALREGRMVEAIRELRQANPGLDLKTAKEAAEALVRRFPEQSGKARSQAAMALARTKRPPTVAPGDRGGIRAVVYALALAGGALAWWMFRGG